MAEGYVILTLDEAREITALLKHLSKIGTQVDVSNAIQIDLAIDALKRGGCYTED